MKKLLLYISFCFFVTISVFVFLLIFKTSYLLNNSLAKSILKKYLNKYYKVKIDFKNINGSIFNKNFKIANLKVEFSNINLTSQSVTIDFNLFKPRLKKVTIFSPILILSNSKGDFNYKKFLNEIKTLFKLPIDKLVILNGKIITNIKSSKITITNLEGIGKIKPYQVLFEAKISKQDLLKRGVIKFRLGKEKHSKEVFGEFSLNIKGLELGRFLNQFLKFRRIKTLVNLNLQSVLEGTTLTTSFAVRNSAISFWKRKDVPEKVVRIHYLQGFLKITPQNKYLKISPLILGYPKIKASLELDNSKILKFKIHYLNYPCFEKEFLEIFLKRDRWKWLKVLKAGDFKEINGWINLSKILNSNCTWVKLIGSLIKGEVFVWKLPLDVKNVSGALTLINKTLKFKGKGKVGSEIEISTKKLFINLENPFVLSIGLNFKGSAYKTKQIISNFSFLNKKLKKIFNSFNPIGKVIGFIEFRIKSLKNNIKLILFYLVIKSKSLVISYPEHRINFILKKIRFKTDLNKYNFAIKRLKIKGLRINFFKCIYNNNKKKLFLYFKSAYISSKILKHYKIPFFKKLKIWDPVWKVFKIENFKLFLKKSLSDISFKNILMASRFKGEVRQLFIKVPIKSKKVPLFINKGTFFVKNGILRGNIEGIFEGINFKAVFILNNNKIKGKLSAVISKTDFKRLIKLYPKLKVFKKFLKGTFPIYIKNMNFEWRFRDIIRLKGNLSIYNAIVNYEFDKPDTGWQMNLYIKGLCSNFNIFLKNKNNYLFSTLNGRICSSDFKQFFKTRNLNVNGDLKSTLSIKMPFKSRSYDQILPYIKVHGKVLGWLKKSDRFGKFFVSLNADFNGNEFVVKKLVILTNFLTGKAELKGNFNKDKILVKGKGLIKNLNLVKWLKTHRGVKLPIIIKAQVLAQDVILPSSHKIQNVKAIMIYDEKKGIMLIKLNRAEFGKIPFSGVLKFGQDKKWIFLDILPNSKGKFLDLFNALYPRNHPKVEIRGKYKVGGYFYLLSEGKKTFYKSSGHVYLFSKNGQIYRAPLLATILAILSPIDIFKGKLPNLKNGRIDYDSLIINGYFRNNIFTLTELYLSATGFRLFGKGNVNMKNHKINLIVYVSPFKTIDVILEKIPIIGRFLLSKLNMLVYVPLQVKGKIKDYKVEFLSLKSVERGIIDLLAKIFGGSHEFRELKKEIKESRGWWLKKKDEILKEFSSYSF